MYVNESYVAVVRLLSLIDKNLKTTLITNYVLSAFLDKMKRSSNTKSTYIRDIDFGYDDT